MSNNRALWKVEDYEREIANCDYIINKTKSWKCRNDHIKRKNRLIKELKEYNYWKDK